MATSPAVPELAPGAPAAKVPLLPLLIVSVLTVATAVAGTAYAMLRVVRSSVAKPAEVAATETKAAPKATHPVALEPMLVNLADEGGHAYLRASVVLSEGVPPGEEKKKEETAKPVPGADAAVRDTILGILGRQTSATLLAPDGKDTLKATLKAALARQNPEVPVEAVYFTDFLVQR